MFVSEHNVHILCTRRQTRAARSSVIEHLVPGCSESEEAVKPRAVDRRIQRTEQLLRTALISLIQEKGFEALSVQDIIARANVGRATF
jgi:AcrR family transcriptional regulator